MMDMARDRRGSTGPARNRHNRRRAILEIASNMRPVDVETTAAILTPRLGLIGDSASFGPRFQGDAMRERILIVDSTRLLQQPRSRRPPRHSRCSMER